MESAISQVQTVHQFSAPSIFNPKTWVSCPVSCLPILRNKQERVLRVECGKRVSSVEKILLENELNLEEEMIGMEKLINEKCKQGIVGGGIVELLECLEREAIMGEDKGREPNDYNRRALIFDKSSRVFQALKQKTSSV